MALRSRSHIRAATSGPGRAPASDGRARHRRRPARRDPAEDLRRRARSLLAEHAARAGEPASVPPETAGPPPFVPHQAPPSRPGRPGPSWALPDTEPDRTGHPAAGPHAPPGGSPWTGTATGPGAAGHHRPSRDTAVDAVSAEPAGTEPEPAAGIGADRPGAVPPWRRRVADAVRERMPLWLQTRCGLERRNVVALTVLLAVAVVLAAQHFWTGRTQTVQAPEPVRAVAPRQGQTEGAGGAEGTGAKSAAAAAPFTSPGGPASAGAQIVVDVSGKVRRPGIHRLPAGSRVADALRAAGGVRPGTSLDGLNQARFLVDGEQVVVGAPAPAAGPAPPDTGTPGAAGAPTAPVSLNTATVDQLQTLPGVGPVLARRIVDYRTRHGGFRSVDQLREVDGIGERRFADLRPLVGP
ncbi:ComEA family DNA-binding protein [Streptomyces sp. LB8]|jgi:competence protein ComEA|uniref:ComEA family DNA-binding protein n=1 Tax=Streptomyces sp. LB8 TaxID=3042509 RepID=UPI000834B873|nr:MULTISPECIES: ComEA family DNA-binding protein [unclassified Streptomyces]MDN5385128.1 ComEA family DNA-binding protein [Streptomyces sp. LB8]